jgi:transcriptional regulator with XRE-family HTH domain
MHENERPSSGTPRPATSASAASSGEAAGRVGENLLRLMADAGLTAREVSEKTGLDARTIRGILGGKSRPHTRSLHRLARGLGVSVDEFFVEPSQLAYRRFDRQTNPLVEEVIHAHRELFAGWTEADFDELHSRMGTGGPLTAEGTLAAAAEMNRKRELHEKLDLLLESSQAEIVGSIVRALYEQIVIEPP